MPFGSVPGSALSRQGVDLNYGVQVNLSGIWEEENIFLLDAPVLPSGLFGNAVISVVDRFQVAKRQLAEFSQILPYGIQEPGLGWLWP